MDVKSQSPFSKQYKLSTFLKKSWLPRTWGGRVGLKSKVGHINVCRGPVEESQNETFKQHDYKPCLLTWFWAFAMCMCKI